MILRKTILNRHLHAILKPQIPTNYPQNPHFLTSLNHSNLSEFSLRPLFSARPFSLSSYFLKNPNENRQNSNKPSSNLPNKTIGPSQKIKKEKTLKLITEKSDVTLQKGVKRSLAEIFSYKNVKKEVKLVDPFEFAKEGSIVHNKLSSDMQMFAYLLYNKGYFKDQKFMPKDKFDLSCFEDVEARGFLKHAAVKFGQEHKKIAMWLSPGDLKQVALFGCPSLVQRSIIAAKSIRKFFQIEEHQVCQLCTMRESCKRPNKTIKAKSPDLRLENVTRLLVTYAMDIEPREGVIPEKIKNCVSRALKQVIKLSQTMT